MLRELIDTTVLKDFVAGVARASNLRVCAYDAKGELIAASPATGSSSRQTMPRLRTVPPELELVTPLPTQEPPTHLAFVEHDGLCSIVAPVQVDDSLAGYVSVGPFHDPEGRGSAAATREPQARDLPILERSGDARAVRIARWASRMLADWCLNEAHLDAAAEEIALLGDISELLSGEHDLQTVLDRIVAQTAHVMSVHYCSLRLFDPKTEELTVKAGYNVRETYGSEPTFRRSENPIDDEALRGEIVYIEDATRDTRIGFTEEAKRLGIVSGLATGMIYRGEPIGVLRVYANHKRRFRRQQRKLLRAVASQAAIAVVNARLLEERLRGTAMERQLATAGQVQARMVRTPPPPHPKIDSALVFDPSWHVGGDFCDVFMLPDGRLAAVVGDVVGHGVPAAILMASVSGALRASARHYPNLADLLAQLNEHVCRETTTSEFVTLLLVAVDLDAAQLRYVSAGHEPLLVLRAGEVLQTDEADLVLGIGPEQRYTEHTLALHPGDFVLLYTDGVVEATDFEERPFGRYRLHNALQLYGMLAPDQALRNIHWDVRRFVGLAEQSDDLTMVGLRVRAEKRADLD